MSDKLHHNDFKDEPAMFIYTSGTTGRPKVGPEFIYTVVKSLLVRTWKLRGNAVTNFSKTLVVASISKITTCIDCCILSSDMSLCTKKLTVWVLDT